MICFEEKKLIGINPTFSEYNSNKKLNFSFKLSKSGTPYDNFVITGFIKILESYPNSPPKIFFIPLLPHINVSKGSSSLNEEIGTLCGDGYKND